MKEMLKRAKHTFLQASAGYIAANLIYIVSTNVDDFNHLEAALIGLGVSAISAGFAAMMNLPKKTDNESEE